MPNAAATKTFRALIQVMAELKKQRSGADVVREYSEAHARSTKAAALGRANLAAVLAERKQEEGDIEEEKQSMVYSLSLSLSLSLHIY